MSLLKYNGTSRVTLVTLVRLYGYIKNKIKKYRTHTLFSINSHTHTICHNCHSVTVLIYQAFLSDTRNLASVTRCHKGVA